jgi:probable phosphoglycerate mutase
LLVRHGQTAWNAERRVLGRTDIPLDAIGREQAAGLARVLPRVNAVYASPLVRAFETASALGDPIADPDLVEMDQGYLEGLVATELGDRFPGVHESWRADAANFRLPGGETLTEVITRGRAALDRIAARHAGGDVVAVVSHQLLLAAVLCSLRGEPLHRWRAHTQRNTAWAEVDWSVPPVVHAMDHAPHLDESGASLLPARGG